MFDWRSDSATVPPVDVLSGLIAETHAELVEREGRMLQLACWWADAHELDPRERRTGRRKRVRLFGGVGTPALSETTAVEFGTLTETSTMAAAALIADAMDLRHRLERVWERVRAGQVRAWKARKVAQATRELDSDAALAVDTAVAEHLTTLPWGRFLTVLEAAVLDADPEAAEERSKAAAAERFVRAGRANEHGLKLLIAKAEAGEVIWFMAMVNRLAEILRADGDTEPVEVRRSKAIGILAQPAYALQLLVSHQSTADPSPTHPDADAAHPDDLARTRDTDSDAEPDDAEPDDAEPDGHVSVRFDDPFGVDYRRLRPTVVLHVHLTEAALDGDHGVARIEGVGPVTVAQVHRFLGDATATVRIQPVLDPAHIAAVDNYEIPQRMREAVFLRNPASIFPFGTCTSRSMDLDHSRAWRSTGPPGQTAVDNLGPLGRTEHNAKTHDGWLAQQPAAGTFVWRSPTGWVYLVTNQGTVCLGRTSYAETVWRAAAAHVDAQTHALAA